MNWQTVMKAFKIHYREIYHLIYKSGLSLWPKASPEGVLWTFWRLVQTDLPFILKNN
jgi:hypothetical protein